VCGARRQQVFGAAPQEALCSENLAAWLKLLPCRGQAGLAALLEPGAVLAAPLHSLQLLLEASPAAEAAMAGGGCAGDAQVRLTLGVTLVTQPEAGSLEAARTLEGVLAAALGGGGGGELPPPCPAAAPAGIFLPQIHPQGGGRWEVRGCRPSGAAWQRCGAAPAAPPPPRLACGGGGWQLQSCSHVAPVGPLAQRLTLTAVASEGNRSGGGGGGGGGGEALLHVMQLLPWELAVRWRTLRLTLEGREASLDDPAVAWHVLRPAVPRGPASLLELLLRLPAAGGGSRVALSLEFEPRLLAVDDYPPDASRGVDLPAALFTLSPPACAAAAAPGAACACAPVRRRGGVHLAALPIPDASMPFNVVCFTSTALALALGAALNVVLRSPAEVAAGGAGAGGGRSLRDRGRRLVAVLLGVGALAVYLDKELQRQAEGWLAAAGLGRPEL
jgi:phosphatidylinositol glycan class T